MSIIAAKLLGNDQILDADRFDQRGLHYNEQIEHQARGALLIAKATFARSRS